MIEEQKQPLNSHLEAQNEKGVAALGEQTPGATSAAPNVNSHVDEPFIVSIDNLGAGKSGLDSGTNSSGLDNSVAHKYENAGSFDEPNTTLNPTAGIISNNNGHAINNNRTLDIEDSKYDTPEGLNSSVAPNAATTTSPSYNEHTTIATPSTLDNHHSTKPITSGGLTAEDTEVFAFEEPNVPTLAHPGASSSSAPTTAFTYEEPKTASSSIPKPATTGAAAAAATTTSGLENKHETVAFEDPETINFDGPNTEALADPKTAIPSGPSAGVPSSATGVDALDAPIKSSNVDTAEPRVESFDGPTSSSTAAPTTSIPAATTTTTASAAEPLEISEKQQVSDFEDPKGAIHEEPTTAATEKSDTLNIENANGATATGTTTAGGAGEKAGVPQRGSAGGKEKKEKKFGCCVVM